MAELRAVLRAKQEAAYASGGSGGLRRHRESGRLPVRERIDLLVDQDSWFEIGGLALPELRCEKPIPGDAVVIGFGLLDGRRIGVIGFDSSVVAGTTAPVSMRRQGWLIEHAQRRGFPLVLLCDADGGRMPDVSGWRFCGLPLDFTTFLRPPPGLPVVPRAAAVLGPSYGDSALHASTAHFVVLVRSGSIALSGPSVVEPAIGEKVSDGELGGPAVATEELTAEWISEAEPWEAAAHLSLDDVIEPGRTREVVAASIDIALGGRL
jgi:acetyl-CoA carboxylase carboxyltransferase component